MNTKQGTPSDGANASEPASGELATEQGRPYDERERVRQNKSTKAKH